MLIGICGGICAGKASISSYLIEEHGFKRVSLARTATTPVIERSAKLTNGDTPAQSSGSGSCDDDAHFTDVEALVDFVTKRWRDRWVTTTIWDEATLDALLRRPFFILMSVDAPLTVRYSRFKARHHAAAPEQAHAATPSLEDFVQRNDDQLYAPHEGLAPLLHRAQLRLLNSSSSPAALRASLRSLDLTNEERLRPGWDRYFMALSDLAALRSNCMKRRVGCVLVRNHRIVSTGYNGTPRGMTNCNHGGCPRCNAASAGGTALDTCLCLHAEENALLEAGRDRSNGAVLYCNTCPCLTCSVKIAQVGISEVVYASGYSVDGTAAGILAEAGVRLRQYAPPREGLVDLTFETARGLNEGVGR